MADEKQKTTRGGIGFLGALGLLFIGLKLTGHITWSWWWVTLPLWGVPAFGLSIAAVCLVLLLLIRLCEKMYEIVRARRAKRRREGISD